MMLYLKSGFDVREYLGGLTVNTRGIRVTGMIVLVVTEGS